jgi:hypothetical protein
MEASHILLSVEHAATFCPVGSNLQLRISPWLQKMRGFYLKHTDRHTAWAPARLTMGASRLLVRATVRIRPLFRSSFAEEMAICVEGGGVALARFISAPPEVGEDGRFDIF